MKTCVQFIKSFMKKEKEFVIHSLVTKNSFFGNFFLNYFSIKRD